MFSLRRTSSLLCFAFAIAVVKAGPLTEAQVTKIINDVRVVDPARGTHPAAIQETIKDEIVLKTGIKSRSELVFQDQTLTRLGPETSFSFKPGTRDLSLPQGTMLLQVPKGIGGAKIRTAAVTAAITGTTIMIENIPNKDLKVLVLEGSLRLSMNGSLGDALLLLPGKMVIMPPNAKRIPEPVSVDLAHIMKTSSLVKMGKKPLASAALIQTEIDTQAKNKKGNSLIETNLVIQGGGTKVVLADNRILDAIDRKDQAVQTAAVDHLPEATPTPAPTVAPHPTATPGPSSTPSPTPGGGLPTPTPTPGNSPTPSPTASPDPSASPTPPDSGHHLGKGDVIQTSHDDLIISVPIYAATISLTSDKDVRIFAPLDARIVTIDADKTADIASTISADGLHVTAKDFTLSKSLDVSETTLDIDHGFNISAALVSPARDGGLFSMPEAGRTLTLHLDMLHLDALPGNQGASPITLNGGNAFFLSRFEGGSGGILNIGDSAQPINHMVDISAPISATTGANGLSVNFGGSGGTVNVVAKEEINVTSVVKVSDSAAGHASKRGGNISLESRRTSGPAITITSSAQLLSLLSNAAPGPGGTIKITSAGGDINLSGTTTASRGTIDIRNNGSRGMISLTNAMLHGDVVKVGVLGADGTLNIGGGTIDADSTIDLYAAGDNGTVNFNENVTLSGKSVKTISGNTVTIRDGKIVTVSGPAANVFTNHPNYTGFGGNHSSTGTFSGSGATTQTLSAGPGG